VIDPFNRDARACAGYQYTTNEKRSSIHANRRDSDLVIRMGMLDEKSVVDVGCGDGTYTAVLRLETRAAEILGIDPAQDAIEIARRRHRHRHLDFRCAFARDLLAEGKRYQLAIYRGVLHHTADPAREIRDAFALADSVLLLEPNGLNPGLKLIERFSKYHVEHEERSFSMFRLRRWIESAGGRLDSVVYSGLVPFFCPDWFVAIGAALEPLAPRIPALRSLVCGSIGILARSAKG
jgi:SAM-dependent methyltransferase